MPREQVKKSGVFYNSPGVWEGNKSRTIRLGAELEPVGRQSWNQWGGPVLGPLPPHRSKARVGSLYLDSHRWHVSVQGWPLNK